MYDEIIIILLPSRQMLTRYYCSGEDGTTRDANKYYSLFNRFCRCYLTFPLLLIRRCEVGHARERVRVIVAQDRLTLRQHLLLHVCGLRHFPLMSVDRCVV